jgi:hypothetical protein
LFTRVADHTDWGNANLFVHPMLLLDGSRLRLRTCSTPVGESTDTHRQPASNAEKT